MYQDPYTAGRPADALIALRQFVGAANYALNDQAYANTDRSVFNPTGQFVSVGPQGTSVEGQPIQLTGSGGVYISPVLVLIAMGAAAVLLWKS